MELPLVSIVIPCYNGESYVARFLDAVLAQTYPNLELILVDDGSVDGTREIVQGYVSRFAEKKIALHYEYQENAGQAAALNRGLKLASGDYIAWMDSDDTISPSFIEARVRYLEAHEEKAFCYGKAVAVLEENPEQVVQVYGKRAQETRRGFFEDVLFLNGVFFPGYMARASAIDEAIPNREIYAGPGGQNAQLLVPLGWYFGEPGYVEQSVYNYYVRSASHSHSINTSEKMIDQLYRYETILLRTLDGIPDERMEAYKRRIRDYYSRLRFGNAVDTKNAALIAKQYREFKKTGNVRLKDTALYMKYTNKWMRKLFRVDNHV